VKEALAMMGKLAEPEYRLPMCRLAEAHRPRLRAILASLGLVKG
jgi:dihydrodipicolinate synthase/N-acetylneuraminate lyase